MAVNSRDTPPTGVKRRRLARVSQRSVGFFELLARFERGNLNARSLHHSASRIRGCLLGGAIGDALGAPLEFMSRNEIISTFGNRIEGFSSAYGKVGAITDDTQMTLFTAEELIRAHVASQLGLEYTVPSVLHHAYLRWLSTQGHDVEMYPDADPPGLRSGWLVQQEWLHARRAPGNTCLSSLIATDELGMLADNVSKGCGGVMRIAPVGLCARDPKAAFNTGVLCTAVTHAHPSGYLAAGYLAATIVGLREGLNLHESLGEATGLLLETDRHEEVSEAVEAARRMASGGRDTPVGELGEGWVAEEALAISVYCALVAEDFMDGMNLAVVHDGDSDSTGSITGNILGTWWGEEALPADLRRDVEGADTIVRLADDLHDGLITGERTVDDLKTDYPPF